MSACLNQLTDEDIVKTQLNAAYEDYFDNYDFDYATDSYETGSFSYPTDASEEQCYKDFEYNFDSGFFYKEYLLESDDFLKKAEEEKLDLDSPAVIKKYCRLSEDILATGNF